MKYIPLILLFLAACVQHAPEPVIASAVSVVYDNGCLNREVGEGCLDNCDCKVPSQCILNTCQLVKQDDGSLCRFDRQCTSGHCSDFGKCELAGSTAVYDCRRECKTDYDGSYQPCYTVCK